MTRPANDALRIEPLPSAHERRVALVAQMAATLAAGETAGNRPLSPERALVSYALDVIRAAESAVPVDGKEGT